MKTIFKWSICFFISCQWVVAQEDLAELGFLRIVNLVAPGEGNTYFSIDGKDIYQKGYRLGQKTGGFGLKPGIHSITLKKSGVESGTSKISVIKGETLSLVGFAEKVPSDKPGDPPVWKSKILRLKQSDPENGYRIALISTCSIDELKIEADISGKSKEVLFIKKMVLTSLDLGRSKKVVRLSVAGQEIITVSPDDPGNYVVLIYEDGDGKTVAVSFYDPKFVISG